MWRRRTVFVASSLAGRSVHAQSTHTNFIRSYSTPQINLNLSDNVTRRSMVLQFRSKLPAQGSLPNEWPETKTSVLQNGITVVSADTQAPYGGLNLYIKECGTRYETPKTLGYFHFLKYLTFNRTLTRSPVRLVLELESNVESYETTVERENFCISSKLSSGNVPLVSELYLDVLRPKLREYILRESSDRIRAEISYAEKDPRHVLLEGIHDVAYNGEGLGQPLYCPDYRVDKLAYAPLESFEQFILAHWQPENLVFVGTGISHEKLTQAVQDSFDLLTGDSAPTPADWKAPARSPSTKSKFHSGQVRVRGDYNSHIAIVFEGLPNGDKDMPALQVLTQLLGSAAKYSADGPGNGNRARLYREVIEGKGDAVAATAFNMPYSDSGLFGVYVEGAAGKSGDLTKSLVDALNNLSKVEAAEVEGAKNRTKKAVFSQTETYAGLTDFIGRQALSGGPILNPAQFAASFDSVTVEDVKRVARRVVGKELVYAAAGDLVQLPTRADIRAALKL